MSLDPVSLRNQPLGRHRRPDFDDHTRDTTLGAHRVHGLQKVTDHIVA